MKLVAVADSKARPKAEYKVAEETAAEFIIWQSDMFHDCFVIKNIKTGEQITIQTTDLIAFLSES